MSPFSTHGAVKEMVAKSQAQVYREGAVRWSKEMAQRNAYFEDFGITTVTFTDDDLADMDTCFATMRAYLEKRVEKAPILSRQLEALVKLDFGRVKM